MLIPPDRKAQKQHLHGNEGARGLNLLAGQQVLKANRRCAKLDQRQCLHLGHATQQMWEAWSLEEVFAEVKLRDVRVAAQSITQNLVALDVQMRSHRSEPTPLEAAIGQLQGDQVRKSHQRLGQIYHRTWGHAAGGAEVQITFGTVGVVVRALIVTAVAATVAANSSRAAANRGQRMNVRLAGEVAARQVQVLQARGEHCPCDNRRDSARRLRRTG
mmetsp:Transcript_91697/g.218469  ORF Transcript_91697/g.218469 Transcript_91697/m.218469 type:complete len:216 (+) Transcript_91697:742-1389(+)